MRDMTTATAVPEGTSDPFDVEPPYERLGDDLPDDRFLDRELSWLWFNQRVLELAEDPDLPLLERVRFLAIFAQNLDEFFMVRVAGLKRRRAAGVAVRAASGMLPRDVLAAIWSTSRDLMDRLGRTLHEDVLPELAKESIELLRWDQLTEEERASTHELFSERVFPVLTPLAVDPAHPFPYISGLSLNLAVMVRNPVSGQEHFARVKVPPLLSRFLEVSEQRFVPLEDVIAAHLDQLFPGMEILQHHAFRVTRNEDLEVEEDDAENLLQALERELLRRRFGPPVRLEVEESMDPHVLELLVSELGVSPPIWRALWTCVACMPSPTWTGQNSNTRPSYRRPTRSWPRWTRRHRRTCFPRSREVMSSCTILTTRSPRPYNGSSSKQRRIRVCSRSNRRSTAPQVTRPSSTHSSMRPNPANR
jgi:polyphosphate kinase